jgi:hypothetical protein
MGWGTWCCLTNLFLFSLLRQADDIQNEAMELASVRNYFCEQLALKTGQPKDKVWLGDSDHAV